MSIVQPPETSTAEGQEFTATTWPGRFTSLLAAVLFFGLALRLLAAWAPVTLLIQKTLPDDAFYYFSVARNVWNGLGLSVDGRQATNGFHPLWLVTLLPVFGVSRTGNLPVHLALSLAACLDVGTAWLSWKIVRRLTGRPGAAVLAAALYCLNPLVFLESLNGLETALSLFCAALVLYIYVRLIYNRAMVRWRDWGLFGLVVGLTLLARTDSVLLAVLLGLHALWQRRDRLQAAIPGLALAVTVTAVLMAPWLVWNTITFGGIVQSSAIAAPSVFRRALFQPLAQGTPFAQVWWNGFWPVIYLSLVLTFRFAGLPWVAWVVALLLARILKAPPAAEKRGGRSFPLLLLVLAASAGLILIHTLIRWYPRSWYFVPLAWASALAAGPPLAGAASRLAKAGNGRLAVRAGALALVLVLAAQGLKGWRQGLYPWQANMLAGAHWAAEQTPPDATIASFNSGLQAYYSDRHVLNLDGVVNWQAIDAIENRQLLRYAVEAGADYLVDYDAYIFSQYAPYLGPGAEKCLALIAVVSPPFPPYGSVSAYTIDPACQD